ncbi:MAG: PKD domain protein [Methanosaeta sp. PtaU1.Bin112]|nr:MAG: PKD domain protein [Methanosaeta sp. PtaU1.Bin112]
MSCKRFGYKISIFILLALISSYLVFYQGSASREDPSREDASREGASYALGISAIDAANLLQWTAVNGTMPLLPSLVFAEIRNNPPEMPSAPSGLISGIPGDSCNYTASSTDPDGDRMRYTFDWGDGTESTTDFLATGENAVANHSWNRAGTYWIKALAVDEKGASSAWSPTQDVVINTPPYRPSIPSGPGSVYSWVEYAYNSVAADPDGDLVEYAFDWGDGNISCTNRTGSANNASAMHSWSTEGDYRIRVVARDPLGAASSWSENLTVSIIANNRPNRPKELFGPSFSYKGISCSYFTMAKDIDDDRVAYCFDWGDGATSTTDLVGSGSIEIASHIWVNAGNYQIRAKATDMKGASSGWMELLNVTIADNDPPDSPALPSGPTSGRSMATYRYATSANDPDGDPVKYVFDWGDKTTSWTGLEYIDSGKNESVPHKWSRPGTFQVKAMALDDKGASSGWSGSLIINISTD